MYIIQNPLEQTGLLFGLQRYFQTLKKTPKKIGSLFGNEETFDGYGIVFDTYDNNADVIF
jgi:hypothetical protein